MLFTTSFLQNILAKSLSIGNIYLSIYDAKDAGNTTAVHYNWARMTRVLTIFEAIELREYFIEETDSSNDDQTTDFMARIYNFIN